MSKCVVNRKSFIEALDHVKHTLASYCVKGVLKCVRMMASDGWLRLQATDLELELTLRIRAEGDLAPCLVNADKLMGRVKAGKHEACALEVQGTGETNKHDQGGEWESYNLIANGGKVSHKVPGECLFDFALNTTPVKLEGEFTVSGQEIIDLLPVALTGIARENTRYAINGVLLEIGKHKRIVATDGRRMVRIDLKTARTEAKLLKTIMGEKACVLLRRLLGKKSKETVAFALNDFMYGDEGKREDGTKVERPEKIVTITGENWTLKALPVEGHFPNYEDVWPNADLNEWHIGLDEFQEVFTEVGVAITEDHKGVYLAFRPDKVEINAGTGWQGESEGAATAQFISGPENSIITAINSAFMRDALKTLDADTLKFRLVQNKVGYGNPPSVSGAPVQIAGDQVAWLLMPVNISMEPSVESVGYNNYIEYAAKTGKTIPDREPVAVLA